MKLGFTGTRDGITNIQLKSLEWWLDLLKFKAIINHGDCYGADKECHNLAIKLNYYIIIHPPTREQYRAHCKGNEEREPKSYLERNRNIVDNCKLLIATPKNRIETGGTWFTINYAREIGKRLVIIYPDGREEKE
jgi:hypothetical protein